jgi:hypothetical protein
MTTHTLFEAGVATTAKAVSFGDLALAPEEIEALKREGFSALYMERVRTVAELSMYDEFKQKGWTRKLARQTTKLLLPLIISTVALAWYEAYARSLK